MILRIFQCQVAAGIGLDERNAPPGRVALVLGEFVSGALWEANATFNAAIGFQ